MSLLIKVEIIHDDEANVYVATSPDLKGLVVEAETLDELEKEVWHLVPELLSLDKLKLRGNHLAVKIKWLGQSWSRWNMANVMFISISI